MANPRSQWHISTGPEVEGRLDGVPTLFINDPATRTEAVNAIAGDPAYRHVYIAPGHLQREGDWTARYALGAGRLVTLALPVAMVPDLRDDLRRRCHLQVLLDSPFPLSRLKPGDELRWLDAPLSTVSFMVGQGLRSHPSQYLADR
jgi:hypothetical protein